MIKKVLSIWCFVVKNFYGVFVWMLACAIFESAWMLVDAHLSVEVSWMAYVENVVAASTAAVVVVSIGYSFWMKRFKRAVAQISFLILMTGILLVFMTWLGAYTHRIAMENRGPDKGWWSIGPNRTIPFAVEYRSAHLFLAEYERRIVFRSGRRVTLGIDTGGAGAFAVYACGEDRFYLIDGFENVSIRSVYLIDVSQELVTSCHEEYERIGRSLFGECRFLGWIHPSGRFEESVPMIDILPLGGICPDRKP